MLFHRKVLACDISTQSLAFSLFDDKKLISYGEIKFVGATTFDRLLDIRIKVIPFAQQLSYDQIVFEAATMVQNRETVILLAYAYGAVVSSLMKPGVTVSSVSPTQWQNFIGNKTITGQEKKSIVAENPGMSKSKINDHIRKVRKQRTIDWVSSTFNVSVDNDNIADAIGIGYWSVNS